MTPYRLMALAASAHAWRTLSGFCSVALLLTALAPIPAIGRAQGRLAGPDIASGLSVQFTDNFLKQESWRGRLDLVSALGATVVRIDLNWPWVEPNASSYDWSLYDQYVAELAKRRLRPLFILNRPNSPYGKRYDALIDGKPERGIGPPLAAQDIAAFGRFAAAAAERYRHLDPIWEIWNEPDQDGSWPPTPSPTDYVALARETCLAVKQRVPDAVVVGPAAAQMPTVWRPKKPLFDALLADTKLLACLDAISLHTHRFRQKPETVSRDYAVLREAYLSRWPDALPQKPIIDTEWGDSVYASGLTEDTQARWVARMYLVNLMEQVRLTNWYCLVDVGGDDAEMEHRFGLVRADGTRRPAYQAYKVLAQQLGAMSLKQVVARFNQRTAEGASALVFCDTAQHCVLTVWETEESPGPRTIAVPGWRRAGPDIDYLGREVASPTGIGGVLQVEVQTAVRFIPVTPQP
jgi:polysaccharide biosynthesis protein PslG